MGEEAEGEDEAPVLHSGKGQYKAHVAQKEARRRDKLIMRQVGLTVNSGSEKSITSEKAWISKNCPWSDSDKTVQPPPPPRTRPMCADYWVDSVGEDHEY